MFAHAYKQFQPIETKYPGRSSLHYNVISSIFATVYKLIIKILAVRFPYDLFPQSAFFITIISATAEIGNLYFTKRAFKMSRNASI